MALTASFIADFTSFDEATKNSAALLQGFQNTALELGPATDRGMADAQKAFEAAGQAARRVANEAVAVGSSFLAAYAEAEQANVRLVTALEETGQATSGVQEAYAAMASEVQQQTRFSDEAVTNLQATLTSIGRVGPENMQLAVTAAANLASFLKVDLATAGDMVAKALANGGEATGKLKTALGDAYQPGMDAADMLQAINDKFGGQAARDAETYTGSVERLNNEMGEFNETIGKALAENLTSLLHAFQAIPEPIQTFVLGAVALGTALAPLLVSLSSLASLASAPAVVTGLTAIGTALGALVSWPALVVAAIAAMAYGIYKYWDEITAATKKLYDGVRYYLLAGFEAIASAIKLPIQAIASAFQWLKNVIVGHSIVPDLMDGIGSEFSRLDGLMVAPAQAAASSTARVFEELGFQIENYAETYRSYLASFGGGGASSLGMMGTLRAPDLFQFARESGRISPIGGGGGTGPVTVNMSGMLSANDPQTKQQIKDLVGEAIMEALRGQRLLSSA